MGFLTNMLSAATKVVLTPIAVANDALNVATGQEPEATKELLKSAVDDVGEATDDLADGEML